MATVRVLFKDGTKKTFEDRGAPGGSYSQTVRYEIGFVVITSAYGDQTAIPSDSIQELTVDSYRR